MIVNVLLQYDTELQRLAFTDKSGTETRYSICAPLDLEKHECECAYHNCGMDVPAAIIEGPTPEDELDNIGELAGWDEKPDPFEVQTIVEDINDQLNED